MEFNIAVLGGDGIGPEVTDQGVRALEAVGRAFGHSFNLSYGDIGGISIDKHGTPLTDETRGLLDSNDAVLFGAVGGPKWDSPDAKVRPEMGLLDMRAHMGVFANIRPVKVYPWLAESRKSIWSEVLAPAVSISTELLMRNPANGARLTSAATGAAISADVSVNVKRDRSFIHPRPVWLVVGRAVCNGITVMNVVEPW